MSTILDAVKNITLFAFFASVFLFLLPKTAIAGSIRKAIIFIVIVFVLTQLTGLTISQAEIDEIMPQESIVQTIGEITQSSICSQMVMLLDEQNIPHGPISVDWVITEEQTVEVRKIHVQAELVYQQAINDIIRINFNVDGNVYE